MWHVQLAGLPIQPYFNIPDRRLRWVIPPTSNIWVGQGHLWGTYCFLPSGKWGSPITIFHVYSKRMSPGSSTGSFPGVWLYFWFPKGYSPLCSMPAQGPWMSTQRLTLWVATAANAGSGVLGIPYPQLSFSMLHSNAWTASNVCW